MPGAVLVAGVDFDAEHQTQSGHEVGVIGVRRPSRLLRVVGDHRTFLLAVQRLDGGVGVENPGRIQQRRHAVGKMGVQPGCLPLRDALERIAQRVFGDHFVHAQQAGIDAVTADRRDVRIAPVAGQHRQHPGAQHFGLARGIGAAVGQRAAFQPARPQPGQVEKLDEIGQLPHRRGRTFSLPAHLHSPRHRLHPSARQQHLFRFTSFSFDSPIG